MFRKLAIALVAATMFTAPVLAQGGTAAPPAAKTAPAAAASVKTVKHVRHVRHARHVKHVRHATTMRHDANSVKRIAPAKTKHVRTARAIKAVRPGATN